MRAARTSGCLTFWCHYTLHLPNYTKRRVRQSLGTDCVERARKLRDKVLANAGKLAKARKEVAA